MPVISRTERQTTVSGTPLPSSTGDGYSAPGRALQQLGNSISGAIGRMNQDAEEQEMFDAKMKVSEYTFNRAKELDDRVANYDPNKHGAPGDFDRTYLAEQESSDKSFMGQFKSPRAQKYAAYAMQQHRQTQAMRAQNARQGFVNQDNIARLEAHAARVGTTIDGTPESITRGLQALDGAINEIPGLTPRQRHERRSKAADQMWKTWAQRATPEQMERTLKEFDEGVDKWRKQFDREQAPASDDLGRVSAKYESGGRGVGFVSSGAGDPGGPSYGIHQLSSKDSMPAFLRSPEGRKYAERFGGAPVGSSEFNQTYRQIASENPQEFAKAQKAYYSRTHYEPALQAAKSAGFDVEDRGVQEAIFSIGVQHGGARKIIAAASASGSPEQQIRSLYQARTQYVAGLSSLPEGTKQSVLNRYGREVNDAVALAGRRDAKAPAGGGQLTGTPSDETGGPGTLASSRDRLDLPDRATMGDHAINEFMQVRPFVMKRLEEERAKRAGLEWAQGVMSGTTPFNQHDAEGRKFIDTTISQTGLGERVFRGDPEALIVAGQLSEKMRYVPKPIYDGLKGLTEHQDPKMQGLGWTALNNLIARNPNILNAHGDDKAIVQQAEYVQRLARLHGMDKALQIIKAEKDPDSKIHKKASEDDVRKFMKGFEGASAETKLLEDFGKDLWFNPDIAYDHTQKTRAVTDYRDLVRRHYEATGNEAKARAYAISEFNQTYGITQIATGTSETGKKFGAGRRLMPYPPERFYQPVDGSYRYIEDDIKKEVGTYVPSAKLDTIRLIADGRTASEAATGRPSYIVRVEREDGRIEELPGRFRPDPKPAQAAVKEKFDKERAAERERVRIPPPPLGEMGVP